MITKSDITDEQARSRKKFPDFYKSLDVFHEKRGTPKSIRRHEVKNKLRSAALKKKM